MTDKEVEVFLEAKEKLSKIDKNLTLKEYTNNKQLMTVYCDKCKQTYQVSPATIFHRKYKGCLCCRGEIIKKGFNTLGDLRPDLIKYFEDKNDAYKFALHSNQKVNLVCPDCGERKMMTINDLVVRGFSCGICGDGVSYPNKILRAFLKVLSSKVDNSEFEKSFNWSNNRQYDGYFVKDGKEYIIEMQGGQHYKDAWASKEETQNVDKEKKQLAKKHGIDIIYINCYKSDFDYIKNNINNSILGQMFQITEEQWIEIGKLSSGSLVKKVVELYEMGLSQQQISKELGIHHQVVRKYLKRASKAGLCSYQASVYSEPQLIRVYNKDGQLKGEVSSYRDMVRLMKTMGEEINVTGLKPHCQNGKPYHGYYFVFVKDDVNNKANDQQLSS